MLAKEKNKRGPYIFNVDVLVSPTADDPPQPSNVFKIEDIPMLTSLQPRKIKIESKVQVQWASTTITSAQSQEVAQTMSICKFYGQIFSFSQLMSRPQKIDANKVATIQWMDPDQIQNFLQVDTDTYTLFRVVNSYDSAAKIQYKFQISIYV